MLSPSTLADGRKQVQHPLFRDFAGLDLDFLFFFFFDHVYREVREVADDRLDIPPDVAHFSEFGSFDLDKRRLRQFGEATRNFGLADAGGADHDDILRHDLLAQILGNLLAPPAVTQRDGDGALGFLLPDDIAVKLRNNLPRRHHRRRSERRIC